MATYAIGDVQGCCAELADLLERVHFDPASDRAWFVGDLVNRGPDSAGVLRLVRGLGDAATVVLGNHDLHLLAAACGVRATRKRDTLGSVLDATDRDQLLDWLRQRPLVHHDAASNTVLVHAGLPPTWDVSTALEEAAAVEQVLREGNLANVLRALFGDSPAKWSDSLRGKERRRYTVNALTRMRFVDAAGKLDFEHSGPPGSQPTHLLPWYRAGAATPARAGARVVFGHWAALRVGETPNAEHNVLATDTACVWGGLLSAVRLEDETWFSVPSRQPGRRAGAAN